MSQEHAQSHDNNAHQHHGSPWILWALGGVTAISLAPFALPIIGIGSASTAENLMHTMGGEAGTGLAGGLHGLVGSLPFGDVLTSTASMEIAGVGVAVGTVASLASTLVIGVGGMLLANWMEKHEQEGQFPWSKVVRYGALATSALIALPSVIGALAIGITFIASLFGTGAANTVFPAMQNTLGATSMHAAEGGAIQGVAASLIHVVDCGIAALPFVGAYFANKKGHEVPENKVETVDFRERLHQTYQAAIAH